MLIELRRARKNSTVTQNELAARLRLTRTIIGKIERGERRIDVIELRNFCEAMEVSFTEFISQFDQLLKEKASESR